MSRIHVLKTWPAPFEAMRAGRKTFEYRLNDRGFEVGDRLVLQEYNPEFDNLTGEAITRRVVYVLDGGKFGVPPKYCVLGVEPEEATPMPGADIVEEMNRRAAAICGLRGVEAERVAPKGSQRDEIGEALLRAWCEGLASRPAAHSSSQDHERCDARVEDLKKAIVARDEALAYEMSRVVGREAVRAWIRDAYPSRAASAMLLAVFDAAFPAKAAQFTRKTEGGSNG